MTLSSRACRFWFHRRLSRITAASASIATTQAITIPAIAPGARVGSLSGRFDPEGFEGASSSADLADSCVLDCPDDFGDDREVVGEVEEEDDVGEEVAEGVDED